MGNHDAFKDDPKPLVWALTIWNSGWPSTRAGLALMLLERVDGQASWGLRAAPGAHQYGSLFCMSTTSTAAPAEHHS